MKKLSLGIAVAAALGFLAGPASAADMPVKAPPPVVMPALYNWSGFYIGPEGGAIMGQRTELKFLSGGPSIFLCIVGDPCPPFNAFGSNVGEDFGHPLHGGFVGGEVGFNWQFGRWIFGIEGDGAWAELEEALTCSSLNFFAVTCH
jgi:outer membrane immunogenic protein